MESSLIFGVEEIFKTFGAKQTLIVTGEPVYQDGEVVPAVPTSYEVVAAVLDYPAITMGKKTGFNSLIEAGDKKCLVKYGAYPEPRAEKDTVRISGKDWRILNVKALNPTGSKVYYYEIHARR